MKIYRSFVAEIQQTSIFEREKQAILSGGTCTANSTRTEEAVAVVRLDLFLANEGGLFLPS